MVSKHENNIWEILDYQKIKSTEQIRTELMEKTDLTINWYVVHRILKELEEKGRIERFENNAGIFWRKK